MIIAIAPSAISMSGMVMGARTQATRKAKPAKASNGKNRSPKMKPIKSRRRSLSIPQPPLGIVV